MNIYNDEYERIWLETIRKRKILSLLGFIIVDKIIFTGKFFKYVDIEEKKYKWRRLEFDDGLTYSSYWTDWKYSWAYTKLIN